MVSPLPVQPGEVAAEPFRLSLREGASRYDPVNYAKPLIAQEQHPQLARVCRPYRRGH